MLRFANKQERKYFFEFLYPWQDEIFGLIESDKFYLTGGTCLSRFYFQHRLSEDLDFFFEGKTCPIEVFEAEFRAIRQRIASKFEIKDSIDSEYFKRIMVEKADFMLKTEFIYELSARVNQSIKSNNLYLDTKENVVANKLTAIYGRKTFKDYVDLWYLLPEFDLKQVLDWADTKTIPLDYEGTVMALIEGEMQGDVLLLNKFKQSDFDVFVKDLIQKFIDNARKIP